MNALAIHSCLVLQVGINIFLWNFVPAIRETLRSMDKKQMASQRRDISMKALKGFFLQTCLIFHRLLHAHLNKHGGNTSAVVGKWKTNLFYVLTIHILPCWRAHWLCAIAITSLTTTGYTDVATFSTLKKISTRCMHINLICHEWDYTLKVRNKKTIPAGQGYLDESRKMIIMKIKCKEGDWERKNIAFQIWCTYVYPRNSKQRSFRVKKLIRPTNNIKCFISDGDDENDYYYAIWWSLLGFFFSLETFPSILGDKKI